MAFVLHFMATLLFGGIVVSLIYSGAGWASVLVMSAGFVLMAGTLVVLTWFAISDQWKPDEYAYGGEASRLPGLRTVWRSAQARERVLWSTFAVVFVVGLVLGFEKSVVGLALVVLSIALAVVAFRARK